MVVKGSARGAPGELAHHLLRVDTNERVNVLEMSGVASLDLAGALAEIDAMGAGSKSKRRMYHASINTAVDETLTPEQQRRARERLAEGLGLAGQPFVVVEHVKAGRPHWHVVWSRVDQETGTAIPDSHNYRKHEEVSRELEVEFGHQRVQGAHVRDKAAEPRPERGPSWAEQRQAERSGLTPAQAKEIVSAAWGRTSTGREFVRELEGEGFTVARGDKRDFVLVDAAGELHGLTRRIEGAKAKDVRERMADIGADNLPDVDEAKRQIKARHQVLEQVAAEEIEGTAESIRAREIEEEQQPARSDFEREASAAVAQLRRTMGGELAGVVVADDRARADKTWQQVLRETDSIEDRRERELYQAQQANQERAGQGPPEKTVQDLAREKPQEAMGGGLLVKPAAVIDAQQTPAAAQVKPKRSFWQRLFSQRDEDAQEPKRANFGGTEVAGQLPEGIQRPSQEVANPIPAEKKAKEDRERPSFHLFARLFGALMDSYHQAVDRARIEERKRQEWKEHAKAVSPQQTRQQPAPVAQQQPEPQQTQVKTADQEREERRAAALRRLREQEEREDRERELRPDS